MAEEILVMVGEKQYSLVKRGRKQAEQVAQLTGWLTKYGQTFIDVLTNAEGEIEFGTIGDMIMKLAGVVSADALIDLYVLVTGCSKSEADEWFDVAQLIDITVELFEKQESFKKVLNRFFSKKQGTDSTEEQSMS